MNRFDNFMGYIFPLVLSILMFFQAGVYFTCTHYITSLVTFLVGIAFFQMYVKERNSK